MKMSGGQRWVVKKTANVSLDEIASKVKESSVDNVLSNNDLMIEILTSLPVRSIAQVKLVSRSWLALISSPHFSLRLKRKPQLPCGLFVYIDYYRPYFISFDDQNRVRRPLIFPPHDTKIIHSCNGLMLCENCFRFGKYQDVEYRELKYYIYNPTTNLATELPAPRCSRSTCFYDATLAFDPSKSPYYKVIWVQELCWDSNHSHSRIKVYSSETGVWRVSSQPLSMEGSKLSDGVYWDDAVHWLVEDEATVWYFKLEEERFYTIQIPSPSDGWSDWRAISQYLCESQDRLLLVSCYHSPDNASGLPQAAMFNVYELKRDYSGWNLKYFVDLDEMIQLQWPGTTWFSTFIVLFIMLGEREEDPFCIMEVPGKVLRYNFLSKTFKEICDFGQIPSFVEHRRPEECAVLTLDLRDALPYIESFSIV